MPKQSHNQTNFTAGELSPRMMGRGDVARYQNGADVIENGVVMVQGGVDRRHGSRYLATTKDGGARRSRLVRYVYSVSLSFELELGHNYVRFFNGTTGAVVLNAALGILELASPYTEAQLPDITTKQDGEALYLYHPDVPTHVLRRLSATLWTLLPVRWIVEPFAEIGHFPDLKLTIDNPAVGAGRTFTTAPITAPGAPTSPVATALNAGASITVTAPASSGGSPITKYTATSTPGGITGESTTTTIVVPGLTNGTAYTFTVTASNKGGAGPASVASNSVTPNASLGPATSGTLTATSTPASADLQVGNGYHEPFEGPVASATGGVSPYTVTWSKLSGGASIGLLDPTKSKLNFFSENYGATNYATFRATVKDAVGATGTIDVPVSVKHSTGVASINP